jgi:hypothetical protein
MLIRHILVNCEIRWRPLDFSSDSCSSTPWMDFLGKFSIVTLNWDSSWKPENVRDEICSRHRNTDDFCANHCTVLPIHLAAFLFGLILMTTYYLFWCWHLKNMAPPSPQNIIWHTYAKSQSYNHITTEKCHVLANCYQKPAESIVR